MAYYKTTFTYQVLSEYPIHDCLTLEQLGWLVSEGDSLQDAAEYDGYPVVWLESEE